jgi:hypothetical protein
VVVVVVPLEVVELVPLELVELVVPLELVELVVPPPLPSTTVLPPQDHAKSNAKPGMRRLMEQGYATWEPSHRCVKARPQP